VPAVLEDGQLKSALGSFGLPDRLRRLAEAANAPREIIAGIRPEHFEDAALVGDKKSAGQTFSAAVDVLESLGADKYAFFHIEGSRATARELEELAADTGSTDVPGASDQVVARLDTASRAREGERLELWFDTSKLHVFNPANGANLSR
jgi:multiple sugar transport system ATP-binding protein